MKRRRLHTVPDDLRPRLEAARLEALALVRALDRIGLAPGEIPQHVLHSLFELDADFAEALWALDQPPGRLNIRAMVRDTLGSLRQWPAANKRLRDELPARVQQPLDMHIVDVRAALTTADAYSGVPGRDPKAGGPPIW